MTSSQRLLVIVLVALSAVFIERPGAQQAPADEQAIRALEEQERLAVLNRDVDALKRIWAERMLVTIEPTGKAPQAGQTVRRRLTHVWKKDGETWRLVARHANILPPQ